MNRKRIIGLIAGSVGSVLLIGAGVAGAATPTPLLSNTVPMKGTVYACYVAHSHPTAVNPVGYGALSFHGLVPANGHTACAVGHGLVEWQAGTTGTAGPQGPKGDIGPAGVRGLTGPAGPAGPAGKDGTNAQALPYGVALVNISRGSAAASTWASLSTTIGSPAPMGDQASSTFRMTCSSAQAPCKISVKAYATVAGISVYPRLDIQSQSLSGGPQTECEYADGADNNGSAQPVGTDSAGTVVPLGVGGSLDCGSTQTLPASGVVDEIDVPAGHYDISATAYFRK